MQNYRDEKYGSPHPYATPAANNPFQDPSPGPSMAQRRDLPDGPPPAYFAGRQPATQSRPDEKTRSGGDRDLASYDREDKGYQGGYRRDPDSYPSSGSASRYLAPSSFSRGAGQYGYDEPGPSYRPPAGPPPNFRAQQDPYQGGSSGSNYRSQLQSPGAGYQSQSFQQQSSFRAPDPNAPFGPFQACVLLSNTTDIAKGFPTSVPMTMARPHPFLTHDVSEDDWAAFLRAATDTTSLSTVQRIGANVAPMVMGVGLLGGLFVTRAIENKMKGRKLNEVSDVIDSWNWNFFRPRLMEVTLARGRNVYAGTNGPPPDMPNLPPGDYRANDGSSSSSSSSSDDRRHRRRDRKCHKKRRDRRGRSDAGHERWRLIIAYRPMGM